VATLLSWLTSFWHALGEAGSVILTDLGNPTGASVSTLIGAVVGGLIAGGATWLVQRSATREARRERLAAKQQADLAVAFTTVVKVIRMYTQIQSVRGTLKWAEVRLMMDDMKGAQPWHVLPPFATFPPEVNFDEKEIAFLLSTKINDVILTAIELADIYNDLRQLMRLYTDRRVALTIGLSVEAMEGTLGKSDMPTEETKRLLPQTTPLNGIFQAMTSKIDEDYLQAKTIFEELRAHCVARFGDEFPKLALKDPPMPNAKDVEDNPEPPTS
jgi:hypothetical protein